MFTAGSKFIVIAAAFTLAPLSRGFSFSYNALHSRSSAALEAKRDNKLDDDGRGSWSYNPFDVDDLSPLDTLLRRGVVPLAVRLAKSDEYEEAVRKYMRKDGCDRWTAQRNMDKYFNDPNGWVVAKQRERDLGEDFGDINAPTGVQKRPVFSALWATFCFWLFFSFFPTRIAELGGVQPSYSSSGMCNRPVRTESGKLVCPRDNIASDVDLGDFAQMERKF